MKYYWFYFVISGLFIIPGIISLALWGVKPSIDFTGGSLLELKIEAENFSKEGLEKIAQEQGLQISSINENTENTFLIKLNTIDQVQNREFQNAIASSAGIASESAATGLIENRFETLGPSIGAETLGKAMTAILVVSIIILLFVWKQFNDKKYGFCAILAMLHDSLILLGIFSILGHFKDIEVDTLFMTAILTILSFSVHDTIVIYDRIRESIRKFPKLSIEEIIDKSVNETLSRSVNNSMTIIFMLLVLYFLGGETIKWFVLALLIGTVSGTYSSTFTAAPLLIAWDKVFKKKKQ